jgi:hypothetical protein
MNLALAGKWAFLAGLVVAAIGGLLFQGHEAVWVPAALGVVVGLLNTSVQDTEPFLLGSVAFLLSSTGISNMAAIGTLLDYALGYVAVFVAGATGVVALFALCRTVRSLHIPWRSVARRLAARLGPEGADPDPRRR